MKRKIAGLIPEKVIQQLQKANVTIYTGKDSYGTAGEGMTTVRIQSDSELTELFQWLKRLQSTKEK